MYFFGADAIHKDEWIVRRSGIHVYYVYGIYQAEVNREQSRLVEWHTLFCIDETVRNLRNKIVGTVEESHHGRATICLVLEERGVAGGKHGDI